MVLSTLTMRTNLCGPPGGCWSRRDEELSGTTQGRGPGVHPAGNPGCSPDLRAVPAEPAGGPGHFRGESKGAGEGPRAEPPSRVSAVRAAASGKKAEWQPHSPLLRARGHPSALLRATECPVSRGHREPTSEGTRMGRRWTGNGGERAQGLSAQARRACRPGTACGPGEAYGAHGGSPPCVSSLTLHVGPWPVPTPLPAHLRWGWDPPAKEGWIGQGGEPGEGWQGARQGPHGPAQTRSQDPGPLAGHLTLRAAERGWAMSWMRATSSC